MLRNLRLRHSIAAFCVLVTIAVAAHQPDIYYAAAALFLVSLFLLPPGARPRSGR
jgi:hypothetical protein